MRLNVLTFSMLATTFVAAGAAAQGAGTQPAPAPAAGAADPAATPAPAEAAPAATEDEAAAATAPGAPSTAVAGVGTDSAATSAVVAAPVPLSPPPPPVAEPEQKLPSFKFYGHGRLDMTYATQRMFHSQFGLWAQSPTATGSAEPEDKPELVVYPRWSRFGVDVLVAQPDEDVKITAKVEIDFHGGGSESRELPRMRHAYGQVQMGDLAILGGQTWDLFAPLIYGGMEQAIFWYGGNLGDRRPQLRATFSPSFGDAQLVLAGAIAQSGAVDMADVDPPTGPDDDPGNGINDGVASAYPALQGLAELRVKLSGAEGAKPMRIGLSTHIAEKTIALAGNDETFMVRAGVAHIEVPVSILTLSAEGFIGENLRDVRGGIGQGIELRDTDGDGLMDEGKTIPGKGGFVQLQLDPIAWYSLQLGAGVDNPRGVNPGGRGLNQTAHIGNAFKPYKHFVVGAVLDYYHTEYVGPTKDADSFRMTAYTMVPF